MRPYNPDDRCPKCDGAFEVRWQEAYHPEPMAWPVPGQYPHPERLRCTCKVCGYVDHRAPLDAGGGP